MCALSAGGLIAAPAAINFAAVIQFAAAAAHPAHLQTPFRAKAFGKCVCAGPRELKRRATRRERTRSMGPTGHDATAADATAADATAADAPALLNALAFVFLPQVETWPLLPASVACVASPKTRLQGRARSLRV